jgi:hypothetical protein
LENRTASWTPARWAAAGADGRARSAVIAALVQHLADLAAAAEGRASRPVPPADHALVLPDQLEVMTADLLAAGDPGALAAAAEAVEDAARLI